MMILLVSIEYVPTIPEFQIRANCKTICSSRFNLRRNCEKTGKKINFSRPSYVCVSCKRNIYLCKEDQVGVRTKICKECVNTNKKNCSIYGITTMCHACSTAIVDNSNGKKCDLCIGDMFSKKNMICYGCAETGTCIKCGVTYYACQDHYFEPSAICRK